MSLLRMGKRLVRSRVSPIRFLGPSVSLAGLVAFAFMLLTGRINLSSLDLRALVGQTGTTEVPGSPGAEITPVKLDRGSPRSADRIRIATFNIQKFGDAKMGKPHVMQTLAGIIGSFDLVAIQEVLSPNAMPVAGLVDLINRSGGRYEATLCEPIGEKDNSYREQYAFVWDTTRMRIIPYSSYVVADTADRMHREPMVTSFESRVPVAPGQMPFRFTIINAHTDPDVVSNKAVTNEMNVLDDVFIRVREYEYTQHREDDIFVVGDLNVDVQSLGELGQIPGMMSIAGREPTNTAGTKTYDHILIDGNTTREFSGRYGVIDFVSDLGLTAEQAVEVSDHRPVWAEFSAYEIPPVFNVAQQGQPVR